MFNLTQETKIISVSGMVHFLTHMCVLIFPAIVIPYSKDLGVPPAEIFPIGFFMYMLYGAMAIPAGYVADKWSRIGILKICVFGMAISSLFASFSTTIVSFTLSLAAIGFFCGFYHPAGMGLIAHGIEKQGSAHGINGILGNLGIAAAPLLSGLVLLTFNWRLVFAFTSALGIIILVIIFMMPIIETHVGNKQAKPKHSAGDKGHWNFFLILCFAMTFSGLLYRANMTSLPAMMELRATDTLNAFFNSFFLGTKSGHLLSGVSALLVSSLFMFSILGQYVGGRLADRFDLRKIYFIFHLSAAPFALGMSIFFNLPLYLAAAGLVFFTLGMQPIENSLASKFLPGHLLSTGYGIKFTLVFGVGSLAVYQVAFVDANWGLHWIYPILTIEALIIAAAAGTLLYATKTMGSVMNTR
ncbi:MAG TPA: MFS transporter [Nitrospinota bacterium]|nr:MFS transporter [Nitrospinota bacterium]|tara:strand:+ start:322808 stop:324046 length:1239 start_codon:yes stop_codon:yes gene_type:complete